MYLQCLSLANSSLLDALGFIIEFYLHAQFFIRKKFIRK